MRLEAHISIGRQGDDFEYHSHRPPGGGSQARFAARYRPVGPVRYAAPGTLEHFLVERYCLYTRLPGGALSRVEIHHGPWPLQDAVAEVDRVVICHGVGPAQVVAPGIGADIAKHRAAMPLASLG